MSDSYYQYNPYVSFAQPGAMQYNPYTGQPGQYGGQPGMYGGQTTMPGQAPMQQLQPTQQYLQDPPLQDDYTYPYNLPQALQLIKDATAGETEDRMFYEYLMKNAPSRNDREVIQGIRDDEIKHFGMFRRIYTDLTGQTLPPPGNVTFEQPASYCAGIRKALMGELGAVQRYRKILFAMQDRVHINMMTEIITDELRHASLYNYIYAKNECRS